MSGCIITWITGNTQTTCRCLDTDTTPPSHQSTLPQLHHHPHSVTHIHQSLFKSSSPVSLSSPTRTSRIDVNPKAWGWGWSTAFNCATNTPFAVSPANRSEMWPLVQVCDLGREGSCVSNTWMVQSVIYWNYRPTLEEFTQDKLAEGLWRFTASESEMEEWTDASGRLEISQEGSESIREAVDETHLMMTFEKSREQTSQSWSIMCSSSA